MYAWDERKTRRMDERRKGRTNVNTKGVNEVCFEGNDIKMFFINDRGGQIS